MKKILSLLTLLLACSVSLHAQMHYSVKGAAVDLASNAKLANTSISILNAKDSTLYRFSRAAANGSFEFNNLTKGKYILLVSYPKYADYVDHFSLDSSRKEMDFGLIDMKLKARLLADVIIRGEATAIKIKGDTTEYNAGSFKIEPNSKVEDLLRQLPGIQVDKDGKITAQGQAVNKVLVDGEEFFGDDPTLVTKNIRGDMVDKVQLFDKKSDQATFTGIDDGQKTKTLNIKLKEDKKNGYFGKIDAGAGNDSFNQGQGMFNAFKAKKKFSVYGTSGNTGKVGLGWEDSNKYGGGSSNMSFSDDGGIMIFGGSRDEFESFNGRYDGQGIPLARTGGTHFSNKWDSDKQSLNLNYKAGALNVKTNRNNLSQNNLPTGIINSNSDQNSDNDVFRQKIDAAYEIKIDSANTLKVAIDGTLKNSDTRNDYLASSFREDNTILNKSTRSLNNHENQQLFNANALWTKKFKKTGRTISLNINQSVSKIDTKGYLNSENDFFDTQGNPSNSKLINQYKTNHNNASVFKSNLAYTEALTKAFSVILNYGLTLNNGTSNLLSFNQSASGSYDQLDPLYSNDFKLDQLINQAGAIFNYKKAKSTLNFGTRLSDVHFDQIDGITNISIKRDFLNWNPQGFYEYRFSQQKSFRLSYNGNTNQPSIEQLQPTRVNTDPLNIVIGNPDLKPSFNNRFGINYNSFKVLSNQYIGLYGGYNFTNNPIVSNVVTDAEGKSTYQSFNLKDKNTSNFYGGLYLSRKIKKIDINVGADLNINGNTYFNFINNAMNQTQSNSYSGSISVSQYKLKKYSFRISFGPNYNNRESSLQKQLNDNGWGYNGNASFSVYLPGKVEIGSDANYQFRQKTQSFNQDFERLLWNTSISKKFFKAENLALKLSGNDLLNQNTGFSRSAYNNMITQNTYTTIKRYYMLSLVWDFNKMGGAPKQN